MPTATGRDPVDHMHCQQRDLLQCKHIRQRPRQFAKILPAHRAQRTFGVHNHGDRRVRPGRGRHLGDPVDGVGEPRREVDPHDRAHFAAINRDEHE